MKPSLRGSRRPKHTNKEWRQNNYYPFGLKHKGYNEVVNSNRSEAAEKYMFGGKELNHELGLDLYDFGARNYDAAIGRWLNVDPLAELDYNWTPYRYGYNNPIMFTDPDGLWEFKVNGDAKSGYIVSLNWEEGDNLKTLSKQTGFSVDEIKSFYNESTIKALEEGNEIQLIKFGGFLEGINDALNEVITEDCNCWGTALEYGETGKVDPKGGIDSPI